VELRTGTVFCSAARRAAKNFGIDQPKKLRLIELLFCRAAGSFGIANKRNSDELYFVQQSFSQLPYNRKYLKQGHSRDEKFARKFREIQQKKECGRAGFH
jgi:hypothetical protein